MISTIRPVLSRVRGAGAAALNPEALARLVPLVVLAAGITALVLMFLWRDQSSYKPLFGEREKVSVSDLMGVLDEKGVPYRLHPDSGQVLVPEDRLGQARMLLAAKGVVAQLPAGLELMDRSDPLGVSQFVQDVRFRRGLEGELAQSIATLDAVASARVHLSIAKSSSFVVSDGAKSSASVVVALKPGQSLGAEQIAAVINMVAGSVAGLDPQRVSLVDQAGNLLSAHIDLAEGFEAAQGNDAARRIRDEMRANVRELLAPVLGEHNYKVSVTADVDNDRVQETQERLGETPRVTSEAMREESGRESLALGVPGSLSNRPVAVAQQGAEGGPASAQQRAATTRQYAYDRTVTQVQRSRGRLNRLHVAVILNSAAAPGGQGVWSPEALADVERVLAGGLGINAERGDSLVVSALRFPDAQSALPWWQERETVSDATGYLLTGFALLLAYLLLARPMLRIAQRRWAPSLPERVIGEEFEAPLALGEAQPAAALAAPAAAAGTASVVPLLENYDLPPPGSPVDVLVDHLRVLAAKEPERVAEVVKQWVQGNGRS